MASAALLAAAEEPKAGDIDFNRARELMQKSRSGQALTPDEQAYLERARQEYARRNPQPATADLRRGGPGGGPAPVEKPTTGLVPIDQMTAKDTYKGQDGGLYGSGKNTPPEAHQAAAARELAKVVPLDADGKPSPGGKIVLLSIGMSNTTMEFSKFKEMADACPVKSPRLIIVDGAQGGMDAARWNARDGTPVWGVVAKRLEAAGVTAKQVQVAWIKHARIQPAQYGDFPGHAEELKGHIIGSIELAKEHFPNLRVAYLSSRIYAGYAATQLNPEPFSYESGFVVRSVIQDQIKGSAPLNYDPAKGDAKAPLLLWGPYLWGDGITPRKSDGLVWKREDLAPDGTHPSPSSGREKVARLLLDFFMHDAGAKTWFCAAGAETRRANSKFALSY
jgi:hypothetical protein